MGDLRKDWRRWTIAERILAVTLVAIVLLGIDIGFVVLA
jgi:hypothetical protein